MNSYEQMVVNWSIFTLFTQLLFCASTVQGNTDALSSQYFCNDVSEYYLESDGTESSLVFDLNPGITQEPCKKVLVAPKYYSFMVHLYRTNSSLSKLAYIENDLQKLNRSCPLYISQSSAIETPWTLDPCQLELYGDSFNEKYRLLEGHIKILWMHGGLNSDFKLSITMFAKGSRCKKNNKHSCINIGQEPFLCISSDLMCDGIEHCPPGITEHSDEDPEMCLKLAQQNTQQMSVWELIASGFLKHVFGMDQVNVYSTDSSKTVIPNYEEEIEIDIGGNKSDQSSVSKGLSRYGPWGYLMLGMLLCGVALLLCGLWECCCRRKKRESSDILNSSITIETRPSNGTQLAASGSQSTPQYDDIVDPPPSYAVLFPVDNKVINNPNNITHAANTVQPSPSNSA